MLGRRVLLVFLTIVGLSASLFFIIFFRACDPTVQTDLLKKAGSTLLQLGLLGTLGAYAKFLLDEYSADRQRQLAEADRERELRETKHTSQIKALNSLTTNYWQIKKALHIIDAHRSAKSYGEQMRQIIDYRLELQRLNNEIAAGLYALEDADSITQSLSEMDARLEAVMKEWQSQYLRLSQLQKQDEATDKAEDGRVPDEIGSLPELNAIRQDRFKAIHGPFERAAAPIRGQLVAALRAMPGSK